MLSNRTPTDPLYRIARGTRPWQFADWSKAGRDSPSAATTFGNRFDDPKGRYRVLYAASQPVSCYMETLARFRPDLELIRELRAIEGDNDFQPIGIVPEDWHDNRVLGTARVEGNFADIYTYEWVSYLRDKLQPACISLGLPDFDLSILMQAQKRIITQLASEAVFDLGGYDGIYYASRHGQGLENWALFEFKATIHPLSTQVVSAHDPAFKEALRCLGLEWR